MDEKKKLVELGADSLAGIILEARKEIAERRAATGSAADTEVLELDDIGEGLQYFQKQYGGFHSERERKLVTLVAGKMSAKQFVEAVDRTVLMCEHRGAVARYLYKVAQSILDDDSE